MSKKLKDVFNGKVLSALFVLVFLFGAFIFFTPKQVKAENIIKATPISNFSQIDNVSQTYITMNGGSASIKFNVENDCYVKVSGIFSTSNYVSINAKIYSNNLSTDYTDNLNSDYYATSNNNQPATLGMCAKLKKGTYTAVYTNSSFNKDTSFNIAVSIGAIYKSQLASMSYVKEINKNTAMVKLNYVDSINKAYVHTSNLDTTSLSVAKSLGDEINVDSNNCVLVPLVDKGYYNHIYIVIEDITGYKFLLKNRIMTPSITTVKGLTNKIYTGKPITLGASLQVGWYSGDIPTFTTIYKNNTNVGTATVTFKGTGVWIGEVTKTFKILPKTKDNKKPTIKGVKNNKKYKKAIKIRFWDESGIKKATLNGKKIKSGKKVKKNGKYKLIVIDNAGNKKIIKFRIKRKKFFIQ